MGSSMDEVKTIMGTPDDQRDVSYRGTVVWTYSFSSVTFRGGKVIDWVDGSRNLKAKKRPGQDAETKERDHEAEMRQVAKELGIEDFEYTPASLSKGARSSSSPSGATNPNLVRVEGYTTKSGNRVESHYRTQGDTRRTNNFSSRGNVNPYSGKRGYTR